MALEPWQSLPTPCPFLVSLLMTPEIPSLSWSDVWTHHYAFASCCSTLRGAFPPASSLQNSIQASSPVQMACWCVCVPHCWLEVEVGHESTEAEASTHDALAPRPPHSDQFLVEVMLGELSLFFMQVD